ncbi:tRNA uridine-5-carboxymethylaminomethyl(34) synthesis GTPase MnmE [soil metagenome]
MAGIAIIRISGPKAFSVAERLAGSLPRPRMLALRQFRDAEGGLIDQGLLVIFPAPASFTGEDVCEFHLHGGMAVQTAILHVLSDLPRCRPAEPGEFTRRAVRNDRLDLLAAEGLSDLIRATSERQRHQALAHSTGRASESAEAWRRELIAITARVTAAIDFADEADVAHEAMRGVASQIETLTGILERALLDAEKGDMVRRGIRVVLAGPPNAGKSTLLNALACRDAAIVSPTPGTTRDTIDVTLDLAGMPVTITDTAGLHDSAENAIEVEGMARTYRALAQADIVLWIQERNDFSAPPLALDSEPIRVESKNDLGGEAVPDAVIRVSARTGEGMAELLDFLEQKVKNLVGSSESPILIRERHRRVVVDCLQCLSRALTSLGSAEIAAENLRAAGEALGRLTGRIDVEEVFDAIFKEFCIGK